MEDRGLQTIGGPQSVGDGGSGTSKNRYVMEERRSATTDDRRSHNRRERVLIDVENSNFDMEVAFLSQIEPSKYQEALKDNNWVEAMQDELLQFKRQNVWTLCPLPDGKYPIGTRWVFRNKTDDRGIIIKNKARLVVQGYCQEEGIDYDETFAPVARLEAIRLFLAFAISHNIKVYQMDIKSAFLYGTIKEEVYVCQPPGFDDVHHPDWVYKLDKALYGLKQAPRAWYDTLSQFLLSNNFSRGTIDKTLFIKRVDKELLLVQIYVDDIIFGSTKQSMCEQFSKLMSSKFEMSALSELKTFLGLQVKQTPHGTFIHQSKYVKDLLNKFDMNDCKIISTPMATSPGICSDDNGEPVDQTLYRCMIGSLMYLTASRPDIMYATCVCARYQSAPKQSHLSFVKRILRYLKGTPVLGIWYPANQICKLVGFTDSDYAGCSLTRKSTSGGCQFFAGCLVSWQSKKQTSVSNSTAEAEYIAAAHCTAQILWLQYQLLDFGITELKTPLLIDSEAAKNIIKNPVYHSKTKHIEIRHHFIRDCFEKGLIVPEHKFMKDAKALCVRDASMDIVVGTLVKCSINDIMKTLLGRKSERIAIKSLSRFRNTEKNPIEVCNDDDFVNSTPIYSGTENEEESTSKKKRKNNNGTPNKKNKVEANEGKEQSKDELVEQISRKKRKQRNEHQTKEIELRQIKKRNIQKMKMLNNSQGSKRKPTMLTLCTGTTRSCSNLSPPLPANNNPTNVTFSFHILSPITTPFEQGGYSRDYEDEPEFEDIVDSPRPKAGIFGIKYTHVEGGYTQPTFYNQIMPEMHIPHNRQ
ncbi:hypothetical protein E3N88_35193 [Mikania micrantha]|uniref:Reverse transcriptase Ty1/copia-type domain-containing protein n=1 Tax=Mikania micrantha TaxID=192012 RepID=A0A5N6M317_9ASTR|nr:hypothetical protein E3N88_35193 [Mikania micrantha]